MGVLPIQSPFNDLSDSIFYRLILIAIRLFITRRRASFFTSGKIELMGHPQCFHYNQSDFNTSLRVCSRMSKG